MFLKLNAGFLSGSVGTFPEKVRARFPAAHVTLHERELVGEKPRRRPPSSGV